MSITVTVTVTCYCYYHNQPTPKCRLYMCGVCVHVYTYSVTQASCRQQQLADSCIASSTHQQQTHNSLRPEGTGKALSHAHAHAHAGCAVLQPRHDVQETLLLMVVGFMTKCAGSNRAILAADTYYASPGTRFTRQRLTMHRIATTSRGALASCHAAWLLRSWLSWCCNTCNRAGPSLPLTVVLLPATVAFSRPRSSNHTITPTSHPPGHVQAQTCVC